MSKRMRLLARGAAVAFGIGLGAFPARADVLKIGGTGAAAEALRQISRTFTEASGDQVEIIPNLGSSGGIRAVHDRVIDLCVSGRLLRPEEAEKGLASRLALRTPYMLVTSHRSPNGLKKEDVSELYRNERSTWPDGEQVRVVLRPVSDSDTPHMAALFPEMATALEIARKRPDVVTAATDHDNIAAAQRLPGSLTGMTFLQFHAEKPSLRPISIDGVAPSFEAFQVGTYGYAKLLYFIAPAKPAPAVERFLSFLRAPEGQSALLQAGAQLISD